MKLPALLLVGLILTAGAAPGAALSNDAKMIERTQQRIAALFDFHNVKHDPPAEETNPFRPEESVAASPQNLPPGTAPDPTTLNARLLSDAAAQIKISGTVSVGDRLQIVANEVVYGEGSTIVAHLPNATVFMRVVRITPLGVTLRLGDSEVTVRY
ncbi:MAG: hypothetical protein ACHQ4G_05590 [Opitutales bacterium]